MDVGRCDVLPANGGGRAGGTARRHFAADQDGKAVASDPAVRHYQTDQFFAQPLSRLFEQRLAADEIPFLELAYPSQVGFENRGHLVELVTIEGEACLGPQRLSFAEP